jgi:hypothetical protein
LAQLASQTNQLLLGLRLLSAIVALTIAFIAVQASLNSTLFLTGKRKLPHLGVLSIFVAVVSIFRQIQHIGSKVNLEPGFFVLLLGYGLGSVGFLLLSLQSRHSLFRSFHIECSSELQTALLQAASSPPLPVSGARLELLQGNAPAVIHVHGTNFVIGRSRRSHLQLNDNQISGTHARLRFAQGSWFIQDQGSSNGTYVNGQRIQAQRINDGDQITMGETTYVFRT